MTALPCSNTADNATTLDLAAIILFNPKLPNLIHRHSVKNFGVMCCESCKAFFRRTALANKGLNELECNRVSELMIASNIFSTPTAKKGFTYKIQSLEQFLKDYSYLCDNFIRKDQLSLIKYGIYDINSFRYLRFYDMHTECMVLPVFLSDWDYSDTIAIELLMAIILFNPDRPNLLHKHVVQ
ncbi:unnamed protein product [Oppiella nova]|uniref:Nuclear receptor domain-containing protein n=1 Tax=Oppiella nova TaxID=334625 RepID=A0A7R9LPR7_9ACAR|nr:unnamed protein product [Oppiella nova]CAG2165397.1 unnamed protein product [Oppiella nova]